MRVRHFVEETFLGMLQTKPVGQIHVAAILKEVGICKGTFYKYYCDKYDLLKKCFESAYYGEILACSETFGQFAENSLGAFRKSPKTVLHAMAPEDSDSLFSYHTRLVCEYIVRDRVKAGKGAEDALSERLIRLYAENVTRLTLDALSTPRSQAEEALKLIHAAMPAVLME